MYNRCHGLYIRRKSKCCSQSFETSNRRSSRPSTLKRWKTGFQSLQYFKLIQSSEIGLRSNATLRDISSQSHTILGILIRMDEVLTRSCPLSDSRRPSYQRMIVPMGSSTTEIAVKNRPSKAADVSEHDKEQHKAEVSRFTRCNEPLEHFPNDYPEIYGDLMCPKVLIIIQFEETRSQFSRTNYYRILFNISPRRWIHFSMSLEIPSGSKYWTTTALSRNPQTGFTATLFTALGLPNSLLEILRRGFERHSRNIDGDRHFRLWLSNESVEGFQEPVIEGPPMLYSWLKEPHLSTECRNEASLSSLRHLGCREVSAEQVIQLSVFRYPYRFISTFEGQLVLEVKSGQRLPTKEFLYDIEVLHTSRDKPGVLRLLALVVDDDERHIQSYLVKMPDTGCEQLLDYANRLSRTWSWQHVENLVWQLIRCISSVHTAGRDFVIGTLWKTRILVDGLGQLYLYRFQRESMEGTLPFPPVKFHEYTSSAHLDPTLTRKLPITKDLDIFQLGQLLWILGQSWATGRGVLNVTQAFHSEVFYKTMQLGVYSLPAAFPRLPENIPEYFRIIVAQCCSGNPYARPTAVELLSRFPSACPDSIPSHCGSLPQVPDVNALQKCRIRCISCNICDAKIFSTIYHCCICAGGDFDICQQCFDQGRHCFDPSHLLRETSEFGTFSGIKRHHSSVDSQGIRYITEL